MNVGELVDQLMGDEADFGGEVVPSESVVRILLPDGTTITAEKLEFEADPENPWSGTLWIHGDYE